MSLNTNTMQSELFLVLSFVFILLTVQLIREELQHKEENEELKEIIVAIEMQKDSLDSILEVNPPYPPVIELSEQEEKYQFKSASYWLSSAYRDALDALVPQIDSLADLYKCNAIQVIGHTDGVPIFPSALRPLLDYSEDADDNYVRMLNGFEQGIFNNDFKIQAATNFDLGVLRAMAVTTYLHSYGVKWALLENIDYWHPYSAGPLIRETGKLVAAREVEADSRRDNAARRRIEIRLFRYTP